MNISIKMQVWILMALMGFFFFLNPFIHGEVNDSYHDGTDVVFACMIDPGSNEMETIIWVKSIRKFGGKYASNPVWIFVPNSIDPITAYTRRHLEELDAVLFCFKADERILRFPFAAKVLASAEAEKRAKGKYGLLAWMDPDNIFVNEPVEFEISPEKALAYRPVHHINIGSRYHEPLDEFWSLVYKDCRVPDEKVFFMKPTVEEELIRPYFNAGHLLLRPEKGILSTWAETFHRLYRKPEYVEFYKKDIRYAIFVHQAVLSAVILAELENKELREFPSKYNYTLNLYHQIPVHRRIKKLNDLTSVRIDSYDLPQYWRSLMEIDEPLKSWMDEQFRFKGVEILAYFGHKTGANNFLNRDMYEQFGWNVTIAGLRESVEGCDFYAKSLKVKPFIPEVRLDEITNIGHYDALAVMPVSSYFNKDPYRDLLDNPRAMEKVKEAVMGNIPVSTICSGARVLAAAGVINGKKILGQPPFKEEYAQAGAVYLGKDFPPQIEGSILTGTRDQYYHYVISLALSTMIEQRGQRGKHKSEPEKDIIFARDARVVKKGAAWQKIVGGFGADGGRDVAETDEGGLIVTGYTFSQGSGDADILVVKTDSKGEMQWARTFGGAGTEYGNDCEVLRDGYLITGYTTSFGAGSKDVYVIKIDKDGEVIWGKTYGGQSWDVGMASCETDKGYMICGFTHSFGKGEEDIYLMNLDREGNQVWWKTYGGERFEFGNSIDKLESGNYIIGASTGTFGKGNCDMYLIEVDKEGNEIWANSIGGQLESALPEAGRTFFDWSSKMKLCSDEGIVSVGYSNARDIMNVFVVKTDKKGNLLWGQNLGNSPFYDYGFSIDETVQGDYVVCGASKSVDGNNELFLAFLDRDGRVILKYVYGGPGSDWGKAVCVKKNGEIIIAGHTNSDNFGSYELFLMELEDWELNE